jgi:MSHA pilin protein MshB
MLKQKQVGFTLVELVIVIVLLGLLAATALPRFLDVTDDAKIAVTKGVGGNFATAVMLVHAQWIAAGNSAPAAVAAGTKISVAMDGTAVFSNENGWPAGITAADSASEDDQTAAECQEVFNTILQNAPSSTTGAIVNEQFVITVDSLAPDVCQYALVINGVASITHLFRYELTNGNVTVTVP